VVAVVGHGWTHLVRASAAPNTSVQFTPNSLPQPPVSTLCSLHFWCRLLPFLLYSILLYTGSTFRLIKVTSRGIWQRQPMTIVLSWMVDNQTHYQVTSCFKAIFHLSQACQMHLSPCVLTQLVMGEKLLCIKKWLALNHQEKTHSTINSSMPNNFHDTFLFPSHQTTISHPPLHLHYLLITNWIQFLPHPCSPLHPIPKQSFRPNDSPLLEPFSNSHPHPDNYSLWWSPTPHQACQRIQWACGGGGGRAHGYCDLTLPILLIFSSRCSLTMVASSWPLPHLATVHHCRRDWSYTPIKKTDIRPPGGKESTGEKHFSLN